MVDITDENGSLKCIHERPPDQFAAEYLQGRGNYVLLKVLSKLSFYSNVLNDSVHLLIRPRRRFHFPFIFYVTRIGKIPQNSRKKGQPRELVPKSSKKKCTGSFCSIWFSTMNFQLSGSHFGKYNFLIFRELSKEISVSFFSCFESSGVFGWMESTQYWDLWYETISFTTIS